MTDDQTNDDVTENAGGAMYDDPNREAVGLDPAWVEGTGGEGGEKPQPVAGDEPTADTEPAESTADTSGGTDQLDAMTKADLLALAKDRGVTPANNDMTKQELIDGIRSQQG